MRSCRIPTTPREPSKIATSMTTRVRNSDGEHGYHGLYISDFRWTSVNQKRLLTWLRWLLNYGTERKEPSMRFIDFDRKKRWPCHSPAKATRCGIEGKFCSGWRDNADPYWGPSFLFSSTIIDFIVISSSFSRWAVRLWSFIESIVISGIVKSGKCPIHSFCYVCRA